MAPQRTSSLLLMSTLLLACLSQQLVQPCLAADYSLKADKKLYQIHGWLLWFAFGLAFPLGIIVSKYFKLRLRKYWFNLHWILQVLGVAATTAGIAIALAKFDVFWKSLHSQLGFVVAIVIWVQFILGVIRPRTYSPVRAAWFFFHWFLGTGAVIVGWYTIYRGLLIYKRDNAEELPVVLHTVFLVQISVLVLIYLLLDRWDHLRYQSLG